MATATEAETVSKAEYDKLSRRLAAADEANKGLLQKLKEAEIAEQGWKDMQRKLLEENIRLEDLAQQRKDFIDQLDGKQAQPVDYDLEPIREGSPTSRYDGMQEDPPRFIFHESTTFANDTGYDMSVLYDRAISAVERAILPPDRGLGRVPPDFKGLPPFAKENELEVIVRIVPKA